MRQCGKQCDDHKNVANSDARATQTICMYTVNRVSHLQVRFLRHGKMNRTPKAMVLADGSVVMPCMVGRLACAGKEENCRWIKKGWIIPARRDC